MSGTFTPTSLAGEYIHSTAVEQMIMYMYEMEDRRDTGEFLILKGIEINYKTHCFFYIEFEIINSSF